MSFLKKVKVLLYGDGMDQKYLQALLERAEPIIQTEKEYCYVKTQESFCCELRCGHYDLVVVSAKEEAGKAGIQAARETVPALPRIWISDSLDYLIEAHRLETWLLTTPIEEPILWTVLARLLIVAR